MEKINLTNYEAYFLDYHDGNLGAEDVAELLLFLEKHPELKELFETFENISLPTDSEEVLFPNKESLKKPQITLDNYEEYMIGFSEGALNADEAKSLEYFLLEHPELKKELDACTKTWLTPDLSIVFEGKEKLYKTADDLSPAEERMMAAMEGLLDAEEMQAFEKWMESDSTSKTIYTNLLASTLTPDLGIVYPNKEKLKRRKGVIIWLPAYNYVAAAASIALLILFWYFGQRGTAVPEKQELVRENHSVRKNEAAQKKEEIALAPEQTTGTEKGATAAIPAEAKHRSRKGAAGTIAQQKQNIASGSVHPENKNKTVEVASMVSIAGPGFVESGNEESPVLEINTDVPDAIASNYSDKERNRDFVKLRKYAAKELKKEVKGESTEPAGKRHLVWEGVKAIVHVIDRFFPKTIWIKEDSDKDGQLVSYGVGSGSVAFGRSPAKELKNKSSQ
jgi:hypothetical protein